MRSLETVGSSHVDGVQGVSHLVQIEVHVVHSAGHITLGVLVEGSATIVLPHVSFLGGDLVVQQGFVASRTCLGLRVVGKHLVQHGISVEWLVVNRFHGVDGTQHGFVAVICFHGGARLDLGHDDW